MKALVIGILLLGFLTVVSIGETQAQKSGVKPDSISLNSSRSNAYKQKSDVNAGTVAPADPVVTPKPVTKYKDGEDGADAK